MTIEKKVQMLCPLLNTSIKHAQGDPKAKKVAGILGVVTCTALNATILMIPFIFVLHKQANKSWEESIGLSSAIAVGILLLLAATVSFAFTIKAKQTTTTTTTTGAETKVYTKASEYTSKGIKDGVLGTCLLTSAFVNFPGSLVLGAVSCINNKANQPAAIK